MYSRYIPNENGGYERQIVPTPASGQEADRRSAPFSVPLAGNGPGPPGASGPPLRPSGPPPEPTNLPPGFAGPTSPPLRPSGRPPEPSGSPGFAGPLPKPGSSVHPPPPEGPPSGMPSPRPPGFGGLSALLRRIDTEDLLVLAVLVLLLKQEGADRMTILIAAALYFFSG